MDTELIIDLLGGYVVVRSVKRVMCREGQLCWPEKECWIRSLRETSDPFPELMAQCARGRERVRSFLYLSIGTPIRLPHSVQEPS